VTVWLFLVGREIVHEIHGVNTIWDPSNVSMAYPIRFMGLVDYYRWIDCAQRATWGFEICFPSG